MNFGLNAASGRARGLGSCLQGLQGNSLGVRQGRGQPRGHSRTPEVGRNRGVKSLPAPIPRPRRTVRNEEELEAAIHKLLKMPGPSAFVVKVCAEPLDFVLPPKDGAYLKDRFRRALLGDAGPKGC